MDKTQINGIAFVLLIILTVLLLHLTPAAMVGMLVFVLIKRLGSSFGKWLHEYKARQLAATITVLVIIAAVTVFSLYISKTLRSEENLAGLASKVGQTITDIRGELPPTLVSYMPESLLDLKGSISTLIQQHIKELSIAGKNGLHSLAHILIGIVISVLLSLHRFSAISHAKPFAFIMRGRFILLSKAFENIVFAQIKISAINTLLTSIFRYSAYGAYSYSLRKHISHYYFLYGSVTCDWQFTLQYINYDYEYRNFIQSSNCSLGIFSVNS
jgi:predicted PurR-regulated permease PerM